MSAIDAGEAGFRVGGRGDHFIRELQQPGEAGFACCVCCCPLDPPGHLLLTVAAERASELHLNTDLQPTGSLFILIALASFAAGH